MMGICVAATVNVGVEVAVSKTTGVRVRELDSVVVSTSRFVGKGVCALSGKKEVDETILIGVEVAVSKTTDVRVRELDRVRVSTSGSVGRGVCALSVRKEVDEISVPLIGVGLDSSEVGVGVSRFMQAVRHRHMMINTSFLKISVVLC
jgi:hypothetical protein